MRIGLMFGLIVALLLKIAGASGPLMSWLFICAGVFGGMALSSKLDAIAQAADRD